MATISSNCVHGFGYHDHYHDHGSANDAMNTARMVINSDAIVTAVRAGNSDHAFPANDISDFFIPMRLRQLLAVKECHHQYHHRLHY
jgi:hypothetical protein